MLGNYYQLKIKEKNQYWGGRRWIMAMRNNILHIPASHSPGHPIKDLLSLPTAPNSQPPAPSPPTFTQNISSTVPHSIKTVILTENQSPSYEALVYCYTLHHDIWRECTISGQAFLLYYIIYQLVYTCAAGCPLTSSIGVENTRTADYIYTTWTITHTNKTLRP